MPRRPRAVPRLEAQEAAARLRLLRRAVAAVAEDEAALAAGAEKALLPGHHRSKSSSI